MFHICLKQECLLFSAMHYLEYGLVRLLFWIFELISLKNGRRVALFLSFFIKNVLRYRRKTIIQNLTAVYGNHLPKPLPQLLNGIYRNFVFLWCEFLQLRKLHKDNLKEHFIVHGQEMIDAELAKGNGVIFLSGHYGNFEWLGQYFAILGYPVNGIAKRQSNGFVNDFIERLRSTNGARVIYKKQAMQQGLERLKNGELFALVADQDARKRGVFVDFMGIPASTPVGPAVLQMRTGMPIYMIVSIRKGYGRFEAYIERIYDGDAQQVNDKEIRNITAIHTSALEKWIYRFPEQWFWMHKRWKTKPVAKT